METLNILSIVKLDLSSSGPGIFLNDHTCLMGVSTLTEVDLKPTTLLQLPVLPTRRVASSATPPGHISFFSITQGTGRVCTPGPEVECLWRTSVSSQKTHTSSKQYSIKSMEAAVFHITLHVSLGRC